MIEAEEAARANFYGLIARLFQAPPDDQLIAQLVRAGDIEAEGDTGVALAAAWRIMVDACRSASPNALRDEHTTLFVGTGKAEVTPYLSAYVLRHSSDNPLVELRQQLASWRISRKDGVAEYEDHIGAICETMRFAIAVQHRSDEEQKSFFDRFIYRGATAFCTAVTASKNARFYVFVARFAQTFFEIEKSAFEMAG